MSWSVDNSDSVMKPEDVTFDFLEEEESVVITQKVEKKIKYLLEKYEEDRLEWMAALIGNKREDGKWIVEDISIMEQEVTSTHVQPTNDGQEELARLENCIGWIHSHHNMKAYFSGTDWETVEMYDVSICVNNDMDFFAACLREVDCPQTNAHGKKVIKKLTVFMQSDVLSEEEQKELDDLCEKNIKEKVYVVTTQPTVYNKYSDIPSVLDWGKKQPRTDQPYMTVLLKKKISGFKEDDVKIENYMELKKKKLMKKYGHAWVCPLSGEVLGRDLENIIYSPYHDQFVIRHYFETFVGDLANDPDINDESQSLEQLGLNYGY